MNDDKEVKIESVSVDDVNTVETPENTSNEPTELEKMTAQLAEMNDKYLRLAAELENTRRRRITRTQPYEGHCRKNITRDGCD